MSEPLVILLNVFKFEFFYNLCVQTFANFCTVYRLGHSAGPSGRLCSFAWDSDTCIDRQIHVMAGDFVHADGDTRLTKNVVQLVLFITAKHVFLAVELFTFYHSVSVGKFPRSVDSFYSRNRIKNKQMGTQLLNELITEVQRFW